MNRRVVVALTLVLLVLAAFSRTPWHEFLNLDDDLYVTRNPHVQAGLTVRGVAWASGTLHLSFWHPLVWISYMLDRQVFGPGPFGFHLTNVILHALSTLILFLALTRMTGSVWKSAFVAAVFGVHPLRVESVAWIAERKDVLSTFFWMLTMLAYASYVRGSTVKVSRYVLVIIFFALGLMAKPMLVTLPFALLLLDYWPLRRFSVGAGRTCRGEDVADRTPPQSWNLEPRVRPESNTSTTLVVEKIPLFGLSMTASVLAWLAEKSTGSLTSLEWLPVGVRVANACVSYVAYLWRMVWPRNLACLYPHPGAGIPTWQVIGSAALLICLTVVALRAAKRCPYVAVGWLWYLGTLVPVIGIVQIGSHGMADRFTYIPTIGLALIVAWGIPELLNGRMGEWENGSKSPILLFSHSPVRSLAIMAVLGLAASTWVQSGYWRNNERLFTRTLELTSRNYQIANNLGLVFASQGKLREAVAAYNEALKSAPDEARFKILNNIGFALAGDGRLDDAIRYYRQALEVNPDSPEVHTNLGKALHEKGRIEEAAREFEEALRINPGYAEASARLALIHPDRGNPEAAIKYYREALKADPDSAVLHLSLGLALSKRGKLDETIAHFERALEIDPKSAEAHNNLGTALASRGQFGEAFEHFREAVRLKDDYAEAHFNLGSILAARGMQSEALVHFREAVRLKPDYPQAHFNLAVAYFYLGAYARAWGEVKLCRRYGMSPDPGFIQALSQKMPEP